MSPFKPIKGYERLYTVSDDGQVWSLPKRWDRMSNKKKTGPSGHKGLFLKQRIVRTYLRVGLTKNGKQKGYQVHRLVAEAFIPNPNKFPCVNHKNSIRTDNRVENLEWCTHKMNSEHAVALGRINKGIDRWNAKLNPTKVRKIRELKNSLSREELSKKFGVSKSVIGKVIRKEVWKHV